MPYWWLGNSNVWWKSIHCSSVVCKACRLLLVFTTVTLAAWTPSSREVMVCDHVQSFLWKQNEVQMWCETSELQLKDVQGRSIQVLLLSVLQLCTANNLLNVLFMSPSMVSFTNSGAALPSRCLSHGVSCLYAWCKQKEQNYCKCLETTKLYKAPSFSKLFFYSRQGKLPRAKSKWILISKVWRRGFSVLVC